MVALLMLIPLESLHGRLSDQRRQIRSDISDALLCDLEQVQLRIQRHGARVEAQDVEALSDRRRVEAQLTVKATRTTKCSIQTVRTVNNQTVQKAPTTTNEMRGAVPAVACCLWRVRSD